MGNAAIKQEPKFLDADDVVKIYDNRISKATAYRIIKKCNDELKKQGFITVPGKISKRYLESKVYL